jgi:hypothetical protein
MRSPIYPTSSRAINRLTLGRGKLCLFGQCRHRHAALAVGRVQRTVCCPSHNFNHCGQVRGRCAFLGMALCS